MWIGSWLLAACADPCRVEPGYIPSLDVGIGTDRYIPVPPDQPIYPEPEPDARGPYFNVALFGDFLPSPPKGYEVVLEAFVGAERFARDSYQDVDFRCMGWGYFERGALRLHLDPAALPAPPVVEEPPTLRDTGWSMRDTGSPDPRADVQISATLSRDDGVRITAEAWWWIYR